MLPTSRSAVWQNSSCHAMEAPEFNPGLASCWERKGGSVANVDSRAEGHHSSPDDRNKRECKCNMLNMQTSQRTDLDLVRSDAMRTSHCHEPFHVPTYYQQSLLPSTRTVSWKILVHKKKRPCLIPPSTQNFHLPHRENAWKICSISLSTRNNSASRNYHQELILRSLKAKPRDKLDHMSSTRFY